MTSTEWTRYAFTLPSDDEPPFSGSAAPLPCEVTIRSDGTTVVHLNTDYVRGGPIHLNVDQLHQLVEKVAELQAGHETA